MLDVLARSREDGDDAPWIRREDRCGLILVDANLTFSRDFFMEPARLDGLGSDRCKLGGCQHKGIARCRRKSRPCFKNLCCIELMRLSVPEDPAGTCRQKTHDCGLQPGPQR